jgi:C4-dicarboxylate-specific signal transduction histidine kinase
MPFGKTYSKLAIGEYLKTSKPIGEGLALGLSVVHFIINTKGTINDSANNPKGTIFTIDFP